MLKKNNQHKWIGFGFISLTFLFFLLFFTRIYPIVISNTDDYMTFANHRHILPEWQGSNPIRVFAEVFMPLVSQGVSLFFWVFGGNLLDYLTFGWAFCVAAAMTGLVAALYRLFFKAGVPSLLTCAGLLIFLLMHFWIFKQKGQDGNIYMLHTVYACTYFYYVIPNLLNAILVLWLRMDRDLHHLFKAEKILKKALFVLLAYLCIYSNIWAGAILASYLGVQLITGVISGVTRKEGFRTWMQEHYVILLLAIVWLSSQFFEINGQRAAIVEQSAENFSAVWNTAINTFHIVNIRYVLFCGLLITSGIISLFFRKDRKALPDIGRMALGMALFIAYLLISCSRTGSYYINRPDVFYGAFFFGAVIVLYCLFEVLQRFPVTKLVLPLLLLTILVECNSMGRTYKDSVSDGRKETYVTHNRINHDILLQLQEAEAAGLKETKIYVPDYDNVDNWPYAIYAGEQISKGFYKLGALNEEIRITEIVPSKDKNSELGIGEP